MLTEKLFTSCRIRCIPSHLEIKTKVFPMKYKDKITYANQCVEKILTDQNSYDVFQSLSEELSVTEVTEIKLSAAKILSEKWNDLIIAALKKKETVQLPAVVTTEFKNTIIHEANKTYIHKSTAQIKRSLAKGGDKLAILKAYSSGPIKESEVIRLIEEYDSANKKWIPFLKLHPFFRITLYILSSLLIGGIIFCLIGLSIDGTSGHLSGEQLLALFGIVYFILPIAIIFVVVLVIGLITKYWKSNKSIYLESEQ